MIARALAVWAVGAGVAAAQTPGPDEVALANARFVLWHQVTVALADQHGRRPDAWTAAVYALARVAEGDDALAIENLLLVAETWLVADRDGVLPPGLAMAGMSAELARRVLCYVAGEGPGRAHRLVGEWGAPHESLDCAGAMAEDFDAADRKFREYPSGEGDEIPIRYGDDRWSRIAAEREVLEAIADRLSADFDWPAGLRLEILSCGTDPTGYRPDTATITLCAETIGRIHTLADGRIGY